MVDLSAIFIAATDVSPLKGRIQELFLRDLIEGAFPFAEINVLIENGQDNDVSYLFKIDAALFLRAPLLRRTDSTSPPLVRQVWRRMLPAILELCLWLLDNFDTCGKASSSLPTFDRIATKRNPDRGQSKLLALCARVFEAAPSVREALVSALLKRSYKGLDAQGRKYQFAHVGTSSRRLGGGKMHPLKPPTSFGLLPPLGRSAEAMGVITTLLDSYIGIKTGSCQSNSLASESDASHKKSRGRDSVNVSAIQTPSPMGRTPRKSPGLRSHDFRKQASTIVSPTIQDEANRCGTMAALLLEVLVENGHPEVGSTVFHSLTSRMQPTSARAPTLPIPHIMHK